MSDESKDAPVQPARSASPEIRHGEVLPPAESALVAAPSKPLVAPTPPSPAPRRSRWKTLALLALVVVAAGGAGAYWWHTRQGGLPIGIASGNGRIEADEIDIDTKFAGRIAEMLADEGDMVKAGQVLARMDTQDLAASLKKSEAQVQEAQQSLDEAKANVEQQKTQVTLAQQEFDRTDALVKRGFATNELLDQRRQALNGAIAALQRRQRSRRRGRARARRRHPRRRALQGQYRRQHAGRAARRAHPIPHRQYRRGAACGRQGFRHARHRRTSTWTSICRPRTPAR